MLLVHLLLKSLCPNFWTWSTWVFGSEENHFPIFACPNTHPLGTCLNLMCLSCLCGNQHSPLLSVYLVVFQDIPLGSRILTWKKDWVEGCRKAKRRRKFAWVKLLLFILFLLSHFTLNMGYIFSVVWWSKIAFIFLTIWFLVLLFYWAKLRRKAQWASNLFP